MLSGGTELTLELANKLGKPVLHIYDTREERISKHDLLCLEILNVAGPRKPSPSRNSLAGKNASRRIMASHYWKMTAHFGYYGYSD